MIEDPLTTLLADGLPFGLGVGNHDQSPIGGGSSATTTKYNEYFGESRFNGRGYYGGHYGSDNDNNYELFSAGGMDFIIIHFEYDTTPEQAVLDWADDLLTTYSDRRAIVSTHYLIGLGNPASFGPQGQATYDALSDHENLFLMLAGHIHGEGRRQDTGDNGNVVNTLLSDYQDYPNGGNGFLRIMTFSPANDTIQVQTYSPVLDQYETDAASEFALVYDMDGSPDFQVLGTAAVPSGSNASIPWPGLNESAEYEWYATVDDGSSLTTGSTWSFTTIASGPDGVPPDTMLTGTPADPSSSDSATFDFSGSDNLTDPGNLTFECELDGGGFVACTNPASYGGLTNGAHVFEVRAIDENNNVDPAPASYSWTINLTLPVAGDDGASTDEDTATVIDVLANDSDDDGDALTVSSVTQPGNGSAANNGSDVTYTPAADFCGSDSFDYTASDGNGGSDTATVDLTVTCLNDPPVADDQDVSTDEDTPVAVTLTASDLDADALTYAVVDAPANGVLSGSEPNLTYTPNPGFTGNDSFSFRADDGPENSNLATVAIEVIAINHAPAAADQDVSTDEDAAVQITLSGSDEDGDTLSYAVVTGPSNGSLSGSAPDLSYTPAPDFDGPDSFTFLMNDGEAASSAATVSITVNPINDAPLAADQDVSTNEDVPVGITLAASDVEGDPLTYAVVDTPANGALSGDDSSWTYTPAANYYGQDSFTFQANDGQADSNIATVAIQVTEINDAPLADFASDATSISVGESVSFSDLSANDPTAWDWSFPGGTPADSTAQNPTVTYDAAGTFDVSLTAANAAGSDLETKVGYITVSEVPVSYCAASASDQSYEYVSRVQVADLDNPSSASGYSDFTNLTANLTAGEDASLALTPGFTGSSYVESWQVWIDFTGDGDFTDAGEAVFSGSSSSPLSGSFAVPASASGTTRMRVAMQWTDPAPSCGNFTYGEVEDYTVQIDSAEPQAPVVTMAGMDGAKGG